MNYWDILGTEPTGDTLTIKRAYAQKVKLYHPEDDPQGFQQLREAYEKALRQAKYIKKDMTVVIEAKRLQPENDVVYEQSATSILKTNVSFGSQTETEITRGNLIDQFMDKAKDLYDNSPNDVDAWRNFLEDESYWNLDVKGKINYRMLNFLLEHFKSSEPTLLPAVWKLLNQHFFWMEQKEDLYEVFPEEFIEFAIERIEFKPIDKRSYYTKIAKKYFYIVAKAILVIVAIILAIALAAHMGIVGVVIVIRIIYAKYGKRN